MNFFSRIFSRKNYGILDLGKDTGFFGAPGSGGVRVGRQQALQVATVFSCLRVLGEGVAQVPLKVMKRADRKHQADEAHPLYELLHTQPNDWMSSFELRELIVWHAALCGTAYCFLGRNARGNIVEIIPLTSGVVAKQGRDYNLTYQVTGPSGESRAFSQTDIWAVRGPSWDGFNGLEILKVAREALGLSIAAERHHSRLHKNSAQPSGLYSIEGALNPEQNKALRNWLDKEYSGVENAGKLMIADRAAKFTPFASKGVDMQHLETRNHQITEICRYFRIMPIMIGYSDKAATYASAEQMFLAHLVHTLMPWYARLEGSMNTQLLSLKDRREGVYVKFFERGLLRGAMKDEAEYLGKLVGQGVLTRNEARELMDRNPLDGLDEPLTPMNMVTESASPAVDNSTAPQPE